MAYTYWRRKLAIKEAQQVSNLQGTWFWAQAMTDLAYVDADMDEPHNLRMVAARAQQLKQEAEELCRS